MLSGHSTAATVTSGAAEEAGAHLRCYAGGPAAAARLPLSLKLVLVVLFVPQELSFFLRDLRLTFERLMLIILTPVVTVRLVRKVASGNYRFVTSDLFVPLAARRTFVGRAVTYDTEYALHHSGPVVLEFLITYASTRILLSGHGQALLFINVLCVLIVMDAALDTATGTYITRELSPQITGYSDLRYNSDMYRLGLLRAMGPLEPPILFLTSQVSSALCCRFPLGFDGEVFASRARLLAKESRLRTGHSHSLNCVHGLYGRLLEGSPGF